MGKVEIQRDEHTVLGDHGRENVFVACSCQALFANGNRVVTGPAKKLDPVAANILVELELHPLVPIGTGMMRSRAASAP